MSLRFGVTMRLAHRIGLGLAPAWPQRVVEGSRSGLKDVGIERGILSVVGSRV